MTAIIKKYFENDNVLVFNENNIPGVGDISQIQSDITDLQTNKADKLQNNLVATTDPIVTNNSSEGYEPLSVWINTSSSEIFKCLDNTDGSAVWVKTSLTIDELGSMALEDATNYYTKTEVDGMIGGVGGNGPILSAVIAGEVTLGNVIEMPVSKTITAGTFRVSLKTLPFFDDAIVKLYKNNVEDASVTISISATLTNGLYQGVANTFVSGSYVAGDVLKVSVTQMGNTPAGTGLSILLNE